MSPDEELQRDVTRAALRALDGTSFALAGSGAIREHGIIDRPTQDVDLFTSDVDPAHFDAAVNSVIEELRSSGHMVDERRRVERFAQLHVTTTEGCFVEIDMGVDSREEEPAMLAVGPVLSLDDAVGNKVSALYSRAEDRDYLDVDSIRQSGKFADTELIAAARDRDLGFEVPMFITQLDGAQKLRPERVADYGVQPAQLAAIKERFGQWVAELRSPTTEQPTTTKNQGVAMSDQEQYKAAIETGTQQAGERLERLGVKADRTPQSGSGDPIASAEAVEILQREGAEATLDARDRLRGNSIDWETVIDVARALEAAPWDKGPTRDGVYSDLADAAVRVGISNGAARDQVNAEHEGDPTWRAVDGTATWLTQRADVERLEAVSGRASSSESGRTDAHSPRRPSYPRSPAQALGRAAAAAPASTSTPAPSPHHPQSAVSQAAPDLDR